MTPAHPPTAEIAAHCPVRERAPIGPVVADESVLDRLFDDHHRRLDEVPSHPLIERRVRMAVVD
jgi:hypothetical protein